ncbi:hypothetical protein, partial [Agrobacterium sp. Azo12]|uniref:hypothetical protein n=1 Tax=Agrobacterium sp. Azo12 TaxID=3031129 RepID=UPI0026DFEE9D
PRNQINKTFPQKQNLKTKRNRRPLAAPTRARNNPSQDTTTKARQQLPNAKVKAWKNRRRQNDQ